VSLAGWVARLACSNLCNRATKPGPEQPQSCVFVSATSSFPDHVGPSSEPPASVGETTLKHQLCLTTPGGHNPQPQTLDPTQHRKAGNLPFPPGVVRTSKSSKINNFVALHPAASSPRSKPTCSSCNKSFSRSTDLNRHFHQVHHRLRWNCYLNCGNNRGNGWSREDKWKEHIRREHPSFNLAKHDTSTKR